MTPNSKAERIAAMSAARRSTQQRRDGSLAPAGLPVNDDRDGYTAHQINARLKAAGVLVRLQRGRGYYYWLRASDGTVLQDVESVAVYSARQLPISQWMDLALAAEYVAKKSGEI